MHQISHKHKRAVTNRDTFLKLPEISSAFLNDSDCLLWLKWSTVKNVSINYVCNDCRPQKNTLKGAREGAIKQGQCSHSLNQPSERNERGHVYEEVIPRGNRAGCIVSVCGGGRSRRRRSLGIVGINGGVYFPWDTEEKLFTNGKLMNRSVYL